MRSIFARCSGWTWEGGKERSRAGRGGKRGLGRGSVGGGVEEASDTEILCPGEMYVVIICTNRYIYIFSFVCSGSGQFHVCCSEALSLLICLSA